MQDEIKTIRLFISADKRPKALVINARGVEIKIFVDVDSAFDLT
jgi:hypothetical protein